MKYAINISIQSGRKVIATLSKVYYTELQSPGEAIRAALSAAGSDLEAAGMENVVFIGIGCNTIEELQILKQTEPKE